MSDYKYFLRIWGIKGPSKAKGHVDDFEVGGWSFRNPRGVTMNASQSTNYIPHEEFGGWINYDGRDLDVIVTKKQDTKSAEIFHAYASGKHFDYVILWANRVVGKGSNETLYTLVLKTAYLTGFYNFEDHKTNVMYDQFSFGADELLMKPLAHN